MEVEIVVRGWLYGNPSVSRTKVNELINKLEIALKKEHVETTVWYDW